MVIKPSLDRGAIGPSLKGLLYQYERHGVIVVAKWPEKRPGSGTDGQKYARRLFREACDALKRMDAVFASYSQENVKGTPFLPRDVLMAGLYGRGPVIFMPDGTRRYPMASRVDMSMLLDNLADTDGAMLYRGPNETWTGIGIGASGQILTIDETGAPVWATPSGGGSTAEAWLALNPGSNSGSSHASKGCGIVPLKNILLTEIWFLHTFGASETMSVGVYRLDASNQVVEVLYDQAYTGTIDGSSHWGSIDLVTPIDFYAETKYAVLVRRMDGSGTSPCHVHAGTNLNVPVQTSESPVYTYFDGLNPGVGSTIQWATAAPYCVPLLFEI